MAKYTNMAPGARGILMKDGATHLVESGATVDRDPALIKQLHPDIIEGDGIGQKVAPASDDAIEAVRREITERAQTIIDDLRTKHDVALREANDRATTAEQSLAALRSENEQLRADAASKSKLPGLTGKAKPALLQIAADEGVTTFKAEDGTDKPITEGTNNDIVAAIEAKREPA